MKHFKKFLKKVKIHPLTYLYFIVSLISGYWKWYFSAYFIVCFHEICHLLMAYSFHFEIENIHLLPFGAYLSLNDFGFRPLDYEMCVVLAGPCCHILIYALLYSLKKYVYIDYLLQINALIFVFNLLPIYPMDGFRFLLLFVEKRLDLQSSQYLCFKISILALCLFVTFCHHLNYYIIFFFLLYQNIKYYRYIPVYLRQYYLYIPYSYKTNHLKVHQRMKYIRDSQNYYCTAKRVCDEEEMKINLIKSVKRSEN